MMHSVYANLPSYSDESEFIEEFLLAKRVWKSIALYTNILHSIN